MGACASNVDDEERSAIEASKRIDRENQKDYVSNAEKIKILLLGKRIIHLLFTVLFVTIELSSLLWRYKLLIFALEMFLTSCPFAYWLHDNAGAGDSGKSTIFKQLRRLYGEVRNL